MKTPFTIRYRNIKLISFIFSMLILLLHEYIPLNSVNLLKSKERSHNVQIDTRIGGNTTFHWINEQNSHWSCNIKKGVPFPFCAVSVTWLSENNNEHLDLSKYSHLHIDLVYKGQSDTLRFFIRNAYTPEIETPTLTTFDTAKFNSINVKTDKLKSNFTLDLKQLRVADWWIDEFKIPNSSAYPDITKVISIGIDIPAPIAHGAHEFELKNMTVTGEYFSRETLYEWVIVFWSIFILLEILRYHVTLRKRISLNTNLVSELIKENEIYKEKAQIDQLTQILNRVGLTEILNSLKLQEQIKDSVVLVIDIDHFKNINDEYGHLVGDSVLSETASVLSQAIRTESVIARWGGEEFVILSNFESHEDIVNIANRLRKKVEDYSFEGISDASVTVSIGAAIIDDIENFQIAFEKADLALYEAKRNGRNKVVFKSQ